jgi:hypothetical protein
MAVTVPGVWSTFKKKNCEEFHHVHVTELTHSVRQMNMDYALCEALKNMNAEEAPKHIVVYDVNCQYDKNFLKWVDESPCLHVHVPDYHSRNWPFPCPQVSIDLSGKIFTHFY